MPHQHISMCCRLATQEANVQRSDAVGECIVGTITRTKHVGILAHERPDIRLSELHQHIGFDFLQADENICQESIYSSGNRDVILSRSLSLFQSWDKRIHKIEFESIHIPGE